MKKKVVLVVLCIAALVGALSRCMPSATTEGSVKNEATAYLNLHDTVAYVGMQVCQGCHANVHQTFIKTGMGQSFGPATKQKSSANLHDSLRLYDPHLDFYYFPFWEKDSLFLLEYRLNKNGDTTHKLEQKIDYVVGSGQHTNSHIFEVNNHLFQAPFTWYAQKEKLDLPPGFENGGNTRFSRPIGLECMSCHNAMPTKFVKGSINKFSKVDGGINCERCHGPGQAHVQKILSGNLTDTAKHIDPSIVNPKKLPTDLQFQLCQRCHLQGNSVLKAGKDFFDFKPGMYLNEVMEIYLPRYSNADDKFIMASHVDRFKQSACFLESQDEFNCTSCHNPHLSVKETNLKAFNTNCINCHGGTKKAVCTAPLADLELNDYNCVKCHMPSSGSIDIPHVTVHDHYIRKPRKTKAQALAESEFLGLYAVNNQKPSARSKTLAYLQQFEKFEARPFYLDSARYFLQKVSQNHPEYLRLNVYLQYLERNFNGLSQMVQQQGAQQVLSALSQKDYANQHAWTAYRIGEAFKKTNQAALALPFYQRSTDLAPLVADFKNKLGSCYIALDNFTAANLVFTEILQEHPRHREALNNLGYVALRLGNRAQAQKNLEKAIYFYPDYELAYLNLVSLEMQVQNFEKVKQYLQEVLRVNPNNMRALQAFESLSN
jgi:predicted CXXCH cytochrome family protein